MYLETNPLSGEFGPVTVRPEDARYRELTVGFNRRWGATPEYVRLVGATEHVVEAVEEAVCTGKRISVRSGGHCFADLAYHSEAQVIVDLSLMNRIYFDRGRNAFAVESGAQLGDVYETLFRGWGVTLPGGVCPTVGIGGHAAGGGHGLLSRQFGNVADLIEAVEIVVVDDGEARAVVASRDDDGDLNDLWWSCSGGGGGNFGIVTRYWFRSPGATGDDPSEQLPSPPAEVLISTAFVAWEQLDLAEFTNLIRNHGQYYVDNSDPDSPAAALCGLLFVQHVTSGAIGMLTQVDATVPGAEDLLRDYWAKITAGTGITGPFFARRLPWMASTETIDSSNPTVMTNSTLRSSIKQAYLRQSFDDDQIAAIYRHMTRTDYANPLPGTGILQLGAMAGGRINAFDHDYNAVAQRDSAQVALFQNYWVDQADDEKHLAWIREIYGDTFASTGGYPAPGERYEGCNINAPDLDILDPRFNKSGLPWHTFYYGDHYARLQRTKSRWDPRTVFRHSLSVEPC